MWLVRVKSKVKMDAGMKCIKYLLFLFNFLFVVSQTLHLKNLHAHNITLPQNGHSLGVRNQFTILSKTHSHSLPVVSVIYLFSFVIDMSYLFTILKTANRPMS